MILESKKHIPDSSKKSKHIFATPIIVALAIAIPIIAFVINQLLETRGKRMLMMTNIQAYENLMDQAPELYGQMSSMLWIANGGMTSWYAYGSVTPGVYLILTKIASADSKAELNTILYEYVILQSESKL